jgi:hypothetical protein
MRWVGAFGVFACALAAVFILGGEGPHSERASSRAPFLTSALGAPTPSASLERQPAPGVNVTIDRLGYRVARGGRSVSLAARPGVGDRAGAWQRFTHGAERRTSFGREAITIERRKTEEFLTVEKRQGTRTWRWTLAAGNLQPQLAPDGGVEFLLPGPAERHDHAGHVHFHTASLHSDFRLLPVEILDAQGRNITPKGLRWSLAGSGASRTLELRLDDSRLPLPYVIDPAITLRNFTQVGVAATGTITLSKPAGVLPNDFLLAVVTVRGGTGTAINEPSGWTLIRRDDRTTELSQALYYKVAGAGEPASYAWTLTPAAKASGGIHAYTGVDNSDPFDGPDQVNTGTGTSVVAPSITTTTDNARVVMFFGAPNCGNGGSFWTPGAGLTERIDVNAPGTPFSSRSNTGSGHFTQAIAGMTGTRTMTAVSSSNWIAQTVALRLDNTPPSAPAPTISESSPNSHAIGSTFYYRPAGAGGTFTVDIAATDGQSGVNNVNFPGLGGGFTPTSAQNVLYPGPYSRTYTWPAATGTESGAKTLTVTDNAAGTNTNTFTVTPDSSAPSGHSASISGGYYTALSVPVTLANGTDTGSGVDAASGVVERDEEPLAGDSCTPFDGSWSTVTLSGGADTSVLSGRCYRYRLKISDRVGNQSAASGPSATAKVDTSAPTPAPTLDFGSFSDAALVGGVVYYRPSAASGRFDVTASGSGDPEAGLAGYTFPAAASGWSRSVVGATATYSHSGSPTDPAEPNDVTAQNNAGLSSGATSFTATPDAGAPTGHSVELSGGPYYTSLSIALTPNDGSDTGSGVDTSTRVYERDEGTLSGGSCAGFPGTYGTVVSNPDTSVVSGRCYRYRLKISDRVGNQSAASGASAVAKVDTSAPSDPSLSYGSFSNAALAGGVVYYRPGAANGQFDVSASSTDGESGVSGYSFPAAASGWSVSGSGAVRTYSHAGSPTDPSEPNNVTATNGANLTSSPVSFTVSPDSTAPTGQTLSLTGGPFYATQSVAFTTGDGSDGESGLDTASRLVERAEAPLSNGSCGSFGSYGGSYTSPDTSVATGNCYRYRFSIADRVGNRSSWVESGEAKVDTSAPAAPGLTVTETPADPDQEAVGQILYYRPGTSGGSFTVSASAADAQSGIKHVSFPAVATVVGGGADDSLAPYEQAYVWSPLTGADTAAPVTATNNANSTSGAASFEIRPDSTSPTSAIQCNSGACSAGWYSSTVSVSLSASDAAAGVSEIRYTTDGSDPSPINGSVYGAPFDVLATTTVRFRAYDKVGNEELVGQQLIRIDTIPPTTTAAAANTSGSVHWNGSGTVFYRPGGSGAFDLTATVTDGQSGPQKASFPAIAGFGPGGDDMAVPYSSSYGYSGTPAEPGAKVVTGYDNVNRTSNATVNITADSAGPTGHSATVAGGYYTALSVAVTLDNGSDAGAGVDPASAVVERDEAALDNGDGSCDPFPGSWAQVTLAGGADTTVQSGTCYRYRYRLADRVGNVSTSGASASAKVDTSAPAAPALAYGSFQNAALAGGVVWYRPTAGSGQFAVTASASDTQSGIASYAFPAAAAGWSRSLAGATATYSHSGSPSDPAEPNEVSAQNNAGLSSAADGFTVSADASAPASSIQCDGAACPGWPTDPVSVTLSSADIGSGVFEIRYTTDGSDPTATTGTVYSGAFVVSVTTEIRYRAFDLVGNAEVVHSQRIEFDVTGPTGPTLTLSEAPADPDQHVAGSTLYYRPGGGRSGSFAVEASTTDPQSGIDRVSFPALTGMTGGGDDLGAPFQGTYGWTSGTSASGAHTVTARNNAGLTSGAAFTVVPDGAGPTGHSVALAGGPYFTALSVPLTLSNGADAGSGVNAASAVLERQSATLSDGNCVSWSGSWVAVTPTGGADTSVLTNSCYRYRYSVSDNVGNNSGVSPLSDVAKVDATQPLTSDDAPAAWRPAAVTVALSVSETGSGVASTQYRVDGGSFQNGTSVSVPAPADHSNDGVHTIEYRSTDAAGNVETLRSTTVRIDTTLPTTIDDASGGWRNSAVTVTLVPSDALSGVASTEYRVDGGSFQNGTSVSVSAPADHSNDGLHTIEYRSTDAAGNVEPLQTATVRIDTTLPTGSIATPSDLAHVNGMVAISASAADAASGVAAVEFRVRPTGAGSFSTLSTDSTAPFEANWDSSGAAEGNAELQIVVSDHASNVLTAPTVTVVVDNPPAVSLDDPGAHVAGMVTLAATASADTNRVVFERSLQGAGSWTAIATDLTPPFAASFDSRDVSDSSYDFRAVATDLAGFTASSSVRAVRVDNTAPTVSVSDPPNGAVVGGPNVHLGALASDLGSGVGSVRFEARPAGTGAYAEVATDLAAPFDATWNASALAGSFELRAVATDSAGNAAASPSVLVSVDSTAPSVTLADPGAAVRGVVTLSATTQGAAVARVVFKRKPSGGDSWTDIATDTAGPWNAAFDTKNVSDGLYDLRAQAADSAGIVLATHTRESVRVDNTAPSVQSATPADGSRVAAATRIVLVATEPITAVRGAILDGAVATPEIAGSRVTFASGSLSRGEHELTGSLEDAVGNAAPFRLRFTVQVRASAALAFSVSKPRSTARGRQRIFVVPVTLSAPAKVEATLLSPTGRRVRTTQSRLPAGRNQVRIAVPQASLPPGRYTILVTATGAEGTQVVRRVQFMVKGVKAQKRQSAPPSLKAPPAVAAPDAPPPSPARRSDEPRTEQPAQPATPRQRSARKEQDGRKTLEAASRFVKPKDGRNLGLGLLLLLAVGGAIAFVIKIELHRLLAWPRRFGG